MTVRGYPFDTTDAAGSVTELEWRRLMQWIMPSGVIRGADNGFAVTQRAAGANMSVDVATGQAFIVGHYVRSDAVESVAVANNATGNPRIDTIVVGFDFVANTSSVYLVAGVAAAAPAPTDLTQDLTTVWEIPLAYVYVAAGENVSIDNAEISDRRQYADPQTQQQGKEPVRLATTAALAASTVTGVARVANANGALGNIDGVAAVVGDRVLDKDHATTQHRGIWTVEDVGSASKPWRMRRPPASDESAEVRAGMWVRVTEGTTLADTGWLLTTNDPIVLGTTGLTFTQFPSPSGATVIAESVLGSAGTFDFTAIPATFRHLRLMIAGRSLDSGSNVINVVLRFNGDSGANYDWNEDRILGATVTAPADALAQTSIQIVNAMPGQNASADAQGAGTIEIPNYRGTTFAKSVIASFMGKSAGQSMAMVQTVGAWRPTAAINRVTVTASAGTFAAGTVATLYGFGAA